MKVNRSYTVYIHITPSNKRYIGLTSQTINQRWRNGKGYSKNIHFYRAITKYGWDNIQHIIYATNLNEKDAKALEISLIEKFHTYDIKYGYNITRGGDTRVITEETRQKISKANKGKPKPEHMHKALSETRKKMKYPKLSEEHKRKISESLIGNKRAKGCTKKRKPVIQKTLNGEIINYYLSAKEVSIKNGYDHSSICKCCVENKKQIKGKYNGKYKGYIWEYV